MCIYTNTNIYSCIHNIYKYVIYILCVYIYTKYVHTHCVYIYRQIYVKIYI